MLGRAFHSRLQVSAKRVRGSVFHGFCANKELLSNINYCRFYSPTTQVLSEAATQVNEDKRAEQRRLKAIRHDYNNRRAAYKREVSKLRKIYAAEVAAQREKEKAKKAGREAAIRRGKLERQRKKNIQSGLNALMEEEKRKAMARKHEEHLQKEKIKREAREELYRKTRQLAIDELEQEAHLWMSTPEEVEAAFTPEAQQLLWARPHGVLGAPNPSTDCHFWQQETHTYKMTKTYKSQRQYFIEAMQEYIYTNANVDLRFWTPERIAEAEKLENRARLRADVQVMGRRQLLRKQADMLEILCDPKPGEIPKQKPTPGLQFLANVRALEREGAEILMADPTKFFIFDENNPGAKDSNNRSDETVAYAGPSLGAPIGLRKIGQNEYPIVLGKVVKLDSRSLREKEKQERENRLLAAAGEKSGLTQQQQLEMAAEGREFDEFPDVEENDPAEMEEARQWEAGLDPNNERDLAVLNLQPALRIPEEEVKAAIAEIGRQRDYYMSTFEQEVSSLQARLLVRMEAEEARRAEQGAEAEPALDPAEAELDRILLTMPTNELRALAQIDDLYEENPGMSKEEIDEASAKIPSLTREQLQGLLERDRTWVPEIPLD